STPPVCSTGGTQVGGSVTISGGTATSSAFSVTSGAQGDTYCFRAEYTPDATAPYAASSHTDLTGECFIVNVAHIGLAKTAGAGTASAGDQIGYLITVTNSGAGTASGVVLSDTLPTTAGLSWTIAGTTGSPTCDIGVTTPGKLT